MHEFEPEVAQRGAQDVRGREEKLARQLAELYNENTLLRERVRLLEREARRAPRPARAPGAD
jgi:hypothetical protein